MTVQWRGGHRQWARMGNLPECRGDSLLTRPPKCYCMYRLQHAVSHDRLGRAKVGEALGVCCWFGLQNATSEGSLSPPLCIRRPWLLDSMFGRSLNTGAGVLDIVRSWFSVQRQHHIPRVHSGLAMPKRSVRAAHRLDAAGKNVKSKLQAQRSERRLRAPPISIDAGCSPRRQ